MNTLRVKEMTLEPGRPKVAIPITSALPVDIIAECEEAVKQSCDILEWRADYYLAQIENLGERLTEKETYLDLIKILDDINYIAAGRPIIFTARTKAQGGEIEMTAEQRRSVAEIVARSELVDFIDLELQSPEGGSGTNDEINGETDADAEALRELIDEVHSLGCRVILSEHNFERMLTPQEMVDLVRTMEGRGADVYKIAAMAEVREDAEILLKTCAFLTKNNIGPLIMLAMGGQGVSTRVAGGRYGSCITFACGRKASAPGQADAATMKRWLDDYYGE